MGKYKCAYCKQLDKNNRCKVFDKERINAKKPKKVHKYELNKHGKRVYLYDDNKKPIREIVPDEFIIVSDICIQAEKYEPKKKYEKAYPKMPALPVEMKEKVSSKEKALKAELAALKAKMEEDQ